MITTCAILTLFLGICAIGCVNGEYQLAVEYRSTFLIMFFILLAIACIVSGIGTLITLYW